MEQKILALKDRTQNEAIHSRTAMRDTPKAVDTLKWKCGGHVERPELVSVFCIFTGLTCSSTFCNATCFLFPITKDLQPLGLRACVRAPDFEIFVITEL